MQIDLGGGWLIRDWQPSDLGSLVHYANNRNVSINLRNQFPYPYTEQDGRDWLARCAATDPVTDFAIATQEEAIGGIGLVPHSDVYSHSAELGYWLGEPHWGQGIMTLAAKALVEWGFSELGLRRIDSSAFAWNPASARVLEKAGLVYEGRRIGAIIKDGQLTDHLLYGLVRP